MDISQKRLLDHEDASGDSDSNQSDYEINTNSAGDRLGLSGVISGRHKLRHDPLVRSSTDSNLFKHLANNSLLAPRVLAHLAVWYFFSFTTLFLNKYILSTAHGDPTLVGTFQMLACTLCGYLQLKYRWLRPAIKTSAGIVDSHSRKSDSRILRWGSFTRGLVVVGSLRFSTILLGLVALWFVPVSFAETVKSSAPVFTVLVSWIILGERSGLAVLVSLIPVMGGLTICSIYEVQFSMAGMLAALATNLSECLQNVYSKRLLNIERYSAYQLQFYTAASSFLLQVPCLVFLMLNTGHNPISQITTSEENSETDTSPSRMLFLLCICGLSFHLNSICEYMILSLVSPVTHSVANTFKRSLLILVSVMVWGNIIPALSWAGTGIVLLGVLAYNRAKQYETSSSSSNANNQRNSANHVMSHSNGQITNDKLTISMNSMKAMNGSSVPLIDRKQSFGRGEGSDTTDIIATHEV